MNGRGKPSRERPYCWQEKRVRRDIREAFDADGRKCSALSVYDALTEIASNDESDTFTRPFDYIGQLAGVTGRTVKTIMPAFEKMRIVHVRRNGSNGLQTANTYTLLPSGIKVVTQGNKFPTQGKHQKSDLSLVLNKSIEESTEKNDDDGKSSSIYFCGLEEAKKHPYWKKFETYCEGRNGNPNLKGFNTWVTKQAPPKPRPKPRLNPLPDDKPETPEEKQARLNEVAGLRKFREALRTKT